MILPSDRLLLNENVHPEVTRFLERESFNILDFFASSRGPETPAAPRSFPVLSKR